MRKYNHNLIYDPGSRIGLLRITLVNSTNIINAGLFMVQVAEPSGKFASFIDVKAYGQLRVWKRRHITMLITTSV
jgi:hypothetical protein